ncbi:DAK2 domain-containing protein [Cellulosimicrobium sp. SH8]|uniref:DAK2 domain-containing protein n=1 Tax=Cellulosimicrobium sp. SH8 TaxID=2952936 RepID=UPI0021F256EB|nr:DAK2 domain-containing protein [Cellulosimicrobium sp. SH8]
MSPGADVVDAAAVVAWGHGGVRALAAARESLDRVNVFPVADADTGTNMYLTLLDAVRALPAGDAAGAADEGTAGGAGDLLVRLARGALVGARGNSGVILSEYLRGLALALAEHRTVTGAALATGLDHAARTARGAVARPAPGTILTAADAAARAAGAASEGPGASSPAVVAAAARDGARAAALRSTGELDVLARAQVLDAGALGLVLVLGALVSALDARAPGPAPGDDAAAAGTVPVGVLGGNDDARHAGPGVSEVLGMMAGMVPVPGSPGAAGAGPEADHEGGEFEVMYVVDVPVGGSAHPAGGPVADPAEPLRAELARIGDSVVVVGGPGDHGSGLWQAHVHTDDPMAAVAVGRAALATVRSARDDREEDPTPTAGDDTVLRQVRVRHLPGRHEQAHVLDTAADGAHDAEAGGPGLVAVTAAPGLVADLARAGAVVLLREGPGPIDLSALRRVAVDARATHVALLPGADLAEDDVAALRATLRDDGVETLEVLPASTDVHVAVALAAAQLVEPAAAQRLDAARSALAAVRWARLGATGVPASELVQRLTDLLRPLLAPLGALVTVLADDDVPAVALDALVAHATEGGAEVVLLRSGRDGGVVTVAVEGPEAEGDDREDTVEAER